QGQGQTSAFLGLDSGLNVGAWRVRQRGTLNWATGYGNAPAQHHWQNIDLYARRALPDLQSELTFGDSYTDGSVFDSYALLGVQLATDDRMRPPSRRGYAPVVRGVAQTNAKVTIRQNGVEIYQTIVPPGPFVINDLYPTGSGGSLEVTVTEADGRQRTYEVPYASVSQLQRPGVTRYSVNAGQMRDLPLGSHPDVFQAAVQHGFSNLFTGYAGVQGSDGYGAALIGGAFSTRAGAFAIDLTGARAQIPGYGTYTGRSVRLSWSKVIPETRTSFSVAAYRYSTSGFFSLTDAAIAREYARQGLNPFQGVEVPVADSSTPSLTSIEGLRQRNRFTLSLSQPLGPAAGSLYANASYSDYWGHEGSSTLFQLGYNNHIGSLSYGLSVSRTRTPDDGYDNSLSLSLSVPLGDAGQAPTFTANLNQDSQGNSQQQAIVTDSLGQYNQFNWTASVSHANGGGGTSGSVGAGYSGSHAIYSANYDMGAGYSQVSAGVSGSVVAYSGGVTFGQPLGDTIAIVHAPGAAGAHLQNAPNVELDSHGNAIVPYLTPFQLNTIGLNPQGMPLGVQLDATSTNVAPTAGAVVMVDFKTHYGRALLVRLHRADGTLVPFGAEVLDAKGNPVGTVGQAGRALLRVQQPSGKLTAHWQAGDAASATCGFHYALPDTASKGRNHSIQQVEMTCNTGSH
ncbi:MAG: fimbria/pilus outer membrane usher protein, partial [Gammaproteobacteria bacterium]